LSWLVHFYTCTKTTKTSKKDEAKYIGASDTIYSIL
jgi:hypothetical protein